MTDLSCRKVAELVACNLGYPALIERGERVNISADLAGRLADLFGTTIDFLIRGEGVAPTTEQVRAAVEAARAAKVAAAPEAEPSPAPGTIAQLDPTDGAEGPGPKSEPKPKPGEDDAA